MASMAEMAKVANLDDIILMALEELAGQGENEVGRLSLVFLSLLRLRMDY